MAYNKDSENEVFNGATFSCGFKLSPTAKGWRPEVHCYANTPEEVVKLVFETLDLARKKLVELKEPEAPFELPKVKTDETNK